MKLKKLEPHIFGPPKLENFGQNTVFYCFFLIFNFVFFGLIILVPYTSFYFLRHYEIDTFTKNLVQFGK